jgi:phosphoribosyl 1,2-cyclic phosphate phosphodiesterase
MAYPSLTIQFLGSGTSSGVPMIGCDCPVCQSSNAKDKRLRSSILVQSKTTSIVVDTSPDFRYQMLRTQLRQLDAILFTHPHKDHIAGLDDIRAFNYFLQKPIDVYADGHTQAALKREFAYAFETIKYPGVPDINLHHIDAHNKFKIGDITIEPILVQHHQMPVLGFRFGQFTYITDANHIEPSERQKIVGSQVLVLNALRKEKHISHFTLQEAVDLAQSLQVPRAFFTHISHQLGQHDTINAELPNGIELAFDGLRLEIPGG